MWYASLADLIILYLLFLDIHSVIGNLVSMLLSYHFDKNKSTQQFCPRLSISSCAKCHIVTSKPNSTRSLLFLYSNNHNTIVKYEAILRVSHFKLVLHKMNQGKLIAQNAVLQNWVLTLRVSCVFVFWSYFIFHHLENVGQNCP